MLLRRNHPGASSNATLFPCCMNAPTTASSSPQSPFNCIHLFNFDSSLTTKIPAILCFMPLPCSPPTISHHLLLSYPWPPPSSSLADLPCSSYPQFTRAQQVRELSTSLRFTSNPKRHGPFSKTKSGEPTSNNESLASNGLALSIA